MIMDFATYKDKVMGCWAGKNIGGVVGAPFEGKRQENHIDFYVQQDLKDNPPPNDDLDLQRVWLNAVEKYGRAVNASLLGDYWLSYIIPDWVEYGAGKNNLRMGIQPPMSGAMGNPYRNSCGCFIRSELWACLAPGQPELAARYAYEDAVVDHAQEGLYGEIFTAAMESAAFVESDRDTLVEIGLSYIPSDSAVARAVRTAMDCYKKGMDWREARIAVLSSAPGTFGVQNTPLAEVDTGRIPLGEVGFDAPGNIGITILGWYYGEGDFGKSLCTAVNCGEDTDCTAATLGALMGIIQGASALPKAWLEPINDRITTCCINRLNGSIDIPNTVTELTDRILRATPGFVGREWCDILAPGGYTLKLLEGDALYCHNEPLYQVGTNGGGKPKLPTVEALLQQSPHAVFYTFPAFHATLDYLDTPYFKAGETKRFTLTITDSGEFGHLQQWATLRWYLPEGVTLLPSPTASCFIDWYYKGKNTFTFEFTVESWAEPKLEMICDISLNGRHTHGLIKASFIQA